MTSPFKSFNSQTFLGIEGGATRTTAVLLDGSGRILRRVQTGPCNLRLLADAKILSLWKGLHAKIFGAPARADPDRKFKIQNSTRSTSSGQAIENPSAVGAFLAGCRTRKDEQRMLGLLKLVWPSSRCIGIVGNDTISAMAAAFGNGNGVMLICGTGSIVRARNGARSSQVGGWGHVGGDGGSGFWMGRELLRRVFRSCDERTPKAFGVVQSVLAFLGLNTLEELVQWSLEAPKDEIASLTRVLFQHAADSSARSIVKQATELLAEEVALAARKVGLHAPQVALNRGIAMYQPLFRQLLSTAIRRKIPRARVFLTETEGAVGAARLAAAASREFKVRSWKLEVSAGGRQKKERRLRSGSGSGLRFSDQSSSLTSHLSLPVQQRGLSVALTEQRNPRTMDLDRRSIPCLVKTMLDEESRTIPAIRTQSHSIARAIGWIVSALKRGGRLFYIGAGTSGRVGVLDASESPPTFGCDPEMVQGIMAGGWRALYQSLESAEDDPEYGRQTVRDRGIGKKDVLVGIAASGSTPFVLGALEEAHHRGAKTILLTFNPGSGFRVQGSGFIRIAIATGPEVLTGSTRLKAGTATKLVLNMFSTIAMIHLGKVRSNLMVALDASCEKAHDRAARIYSALKKVSYEKAWQRLEKNKWNLKNALDR